MNTFGSVDGYFQFPLPASLLLKEVVMHVALRSEFCDDKDMGILQAGTEKQQDIRMSEFAV